MQRFSFLIVVLMFMVSFGYAGTRVETEDSVRPIGLPKETDKLRAREGALRKAWLDAGTLLTKDEAAATLFRARVEKMTLAELEAGTETVEVLKQANRRGFYRVTLAVTFKDGVLEGALGLGDSSALSELRDRRIVVVIPEEHIGRPVPDPAGETELIRKLLEAGLRVVDRNQIDKIREIDLEKATADGASPTELLSIAKDQGCEYLIVGEAFSHELPRAASLGTNLRACQARVEARMFAVDTGDILLADGVEASDMAPSELVAGKKALRLAAGKLGDRFILTLLQRVESAREEAQRVQFVLAGATFAQKEEFKKLLSNLGEDVFAVRDVSYLNQRATVELRSYLPSGELTALVFSKAPEVSFQFEPVQATPGRVDLRIRRATEETLATGAAPPLTVNKPRPPENAAPVTTEEVERLRNERWIALIIGLNDYSGSGGAIPNLETARNDAGELAKLLEESYRFEVVTLFDGDASISKIQQTFESLAKQVTTNDNVLIYYAGHGHLLEGSSLGLWNVADSKLPTDGIYNAQIKEFVRRLKARRVLLVSDSCYSGDFLRRAIGRPQTENVVSDEAESLQISAAIARNASPAREVLSSGAMAPVADKSSDGFCAGHSPFACALLDALRNAPKGGALSTTDLFVHVYSRVEREEGFDPANGPQKGVLPGHQTGEFFVIRFQ